MIRLKLYTWLTIFFRRFARYISSGLWLLASPALPWRPANWANDRPNFTSLEVARAQYEKVAEDMRLKYEAAPRDVIRDQAKRIVEKRV